MKKIVESYQRKLAAEDGWVLKRGAQLRIALCYPNLYSIGMANLGFQAMYEIFNNIPEVSCERAFLPDSVSRERGDRVRSQRVSKGSSNNRALPHGRASDTSGYDQALPSGRASAQHIDEMSEYERTGTP